MVSGEKVGVSVVSGAGLVYLWCLMEGVCIWFLMEGWCICGASLVPSGRLVYLCCVRKYVGVLVVYTSILVCLWWCLVEG